MIAADQNRMFALPAQACLSGQGFFHHRSCVGKHFDRMAMGGQHSSALFELAFDLVMIIARAGIGGNQTAFFP